jgi:hypothetical protein
MPPIPVSLTGDQLALPAPPLGVADVHPVQLSGKQGRLFSAGSGPDLDDHVPVVVGIARQQLNAELLHERRFLGLRLFDLRPGQFAELGIALGVVRSAELLAYDLQASVCLDDGLDL